MKPEGKKLNLFLVTIISIFFICLFNFSSIAATCDLPGDFVGPMGDPTPDGKVDFNDLMVFATAYGSEVGDPNWNALCDICGYLGDPSPDGKINFDDLMVFATNYGKECPSEEGILEVASAQIDLEIGGVVEVTDEASEIYRTSLVIDPMNKEQLVNSRGLSEIAILLNAQVLGTNYLGNLQGWVITPVGVTAAEDIIGLIQGSLEITYNEDKLSNSGVAKDSSVNVYRVLCVFDPITFMPVPVPGVSWEEVPGEMITHETDKVKIEIGIGDLLYLYTLTVTNCEPPTNLGTPLPGDLLYRLSEVGVNDNWVPGHVGIYVGERYGDHDDDPSTPDTVYNVIEALGSLFGYIGLGPDEVLRTHYEDITKFGGDKYVYMGAREPAVRKLTHQERNQLIAYLEDNVGDDYAFSETVFGIWFGLARGDIVKGDDDQYNCVGLSEAAYESVGAGIVSDEDEGNILLPLFPQDNLLSPQEQLFRTVPASGIINENTSPVISSLEMVPENPALGDWVTVTCHATDQDQDILTYKWSVPNETEPIIRGEQLDFQVPWVAGDYQIECRVFDNYGGEDSDTKDINLGSTGPVHNLTKDTYYNTIQAALDDTDSGDTIEVSDGTYNELIAFPENKAITLQSMNGPEYTIIDGSGLGDSVVTIIDALEGTIIEGITITGGNTDDYGGGINLSESYLTLTNCTITNNFAAQSGGGVSTIYIVEGTTFESYLTLTNCTITNNSATRHGGGIDTFHGIFTLTNCTITNNSCGICGGGLDVYCGTFELTNCTITNNSATQGGGMRLWESISTLTNCTINNNSAVWGGGIHSDDKQATFLSGITITDCTINENSAVNYGGGIYLYKPAHEIQIIGNQVRYNSSGYSGGGIYIYEPSVTPTIVSNTLCGNISDNVATADNQIYPNDYPNNDISASCNGTYSLRDIGPAGGYIFYDKGSYSDGWRYLEAAPVSTEWMNK